MQIYFYGFCLRKQYSTRLKEKEATPDSPPVSPLKTNLLLHPTKDRVYFKVIDY